MRAPAVEDTGLADRLFAVDCSTVSRPPRLGAEELAGLRRVLRTALVSDALDELGLRQQAFRHDIRRLAGRGVLVGHAFPVIAAPMSGAAEDPYAGLRAALLELGRDDVYVLATARSDGYSGWGELLSITAGAAGAAGVVTDGLVRDLEQIDALAFQTFARGTMPVDVAGRAEIRATDRVTIDGIDVERDDLIVGDADGVVVLPTGVRDDVIARALERHASEDAFRHAVEDGMPPAEALDRFRVL